MGPIVCPETSVRNYYYTLRDGTEERSSKQPIRGMSEKYPAILNIPRTGRVALM